MLRHDVIPAKCRPLLAAVLILSSSMVSSFGQQDQISDSLKALLDRANAGDPKAQNDLGVAYTYGNGGVPPNFAEAARLYRLAADQGLPNAQFNLGSFYATGRGVNLSYADAVHWYSLAADQGFALAQAALGDEYAFDHHGVPRNYVQAYKWLSLAIPKLSARDDPQQGYSHNFDALVAKMTPEQIEEGKTLAADWKPEETAAAAPTPPKQEQPQSPTPAPASTSTNTSENDADRKQEETASDASKPPDAAPVAPTPPKQEQPQSPTPAPASTSTNTSETAAADIASLIGTIVSFAIVAVVITWIVRMFRKKPQPVSPDGYVEAKTGVPYAKSFQWKKQGFPEEGFDVVLNNANYKTTIFDRSYGPDNHIAVTRDAVTINGKRYRRGEAFRGFCGSDEQFTKGGYIYKRLSFRYGTEIFHIPGYWFDEPEFQHLVAGLNDLLQDVPFADSSSKPPRPSPF